MQYALTTYPLSKEFRRGLDKTLGETPIYLDYSDLRKLSPVNFIRRLRTLDASRLLLPIEDELSRCILPTLKSVAAITDARHISIVHPDFRTETVRRWSAVGAVAALMNASATAWRDMSRCMAEMTALKAAPPIRHSYGSGSDVLYLNANLWFGMKAGGSIGHVAGVVNALQEGGRRVVLASPAPPTMIRPDVEYVPLNVPEVFGLPFEKSYYTFQRMTVEQLLRQTFTSRPAFIYQRMSPANYAGVALSRRWGIPLVLEYNGSEVWVGKNWGRGFRYPQAAAAAEEVSLRHADLVVTVSDVLADELVDRGVSRDRVVWYPNCVDPAVFDPARFSDGDCQALRRHLGISPESTVVMFIGTFGQWHGVDVFAKSIRSLVDRNSESLRAANVRFVLVGDGLMMPTVRETLTGGQCGNFVTLTGLVPQTEAPKYLAMSDVVVSPHVPNSDGSRFFGSPTKLFEYMAMGKPIIASDLDQIGQVLRNSIRAEGLSADEPPRADTSLAVLCRPGDVDGLSNAIAFMVDRPDWRKTLGNNARLEALNQYTWSRHTSVILDRLAQLKG